MIITRHIEYEVDIKISDDLTCVGTDLADFVGDGNCVDYKEIVAYDLSDKNLEDYLADIIQKNIKIKKVWYEVEEEKNDKNN